MEVKVSEPQLEATAAAVAAAGPSVEIAVKRNQSKYDFVKVRVWMGDHFYVLSRYLVCRALVSTKINSKDAVQISLDLKRTLVDLGLTDIMQEQFEDFLYKTMLVFGYGEVHINRYRMMSSFHRNRVPLLIILAGTSCIGKSTLATKLADRLNLSSVLQTDLIFELMCNFSGREETAYNSTTFSSKDELIENYKQDCQVVRNGVTSDIEKCLKEGKSLIIEGFHIDPRLYQKEIEVQITKESDGKNGLSGIVVPFLLTLDSKSHFEFIQNSPDPRYRTEEAAAMGYRNLQDVQEYLVKHLKEEKMIPFTEILINLHSFHETLDLLHDIVLKRIEEVYEVSNKDDAITIRICTHIRASLLESGTSNSWWRQLGWVPIQSTKSTVFWVLTIELQSVSQIWLFTIKDDTPSVTTPYAAVNRITILEEETQDFEKGTMKPNVLIPVLPPRYSSRLFRSSFSTCASVYVSAKYELWFCSAVSFLVLLTSLNYWRHPVHGWRRNVDMAAVFVGMMYHIYCSAFCANQIYQLLYLLLVVKMGYIYAQARSAKNKNISSKWHCGLHIVGNLANVMLYTGLSL